MPGKRTEIPDTLRRSPVKAQRTYREAHDSAVEQHGEGERAHRVAFAAVKHSFEKVGDHWEPKRAGGRRTRGPPARAPARTRARRSAVWTTTGTRSRSSTTGRG